ncbi:MAG: beta-hexosaminidase, partial [Lachnospiraceae bacterium]|nr:beta-hexosaminidase [Lachnospiraceae bacterium]
MGIRVHRKKERNVEDMRKRVLASILTLVLMITTLLPHTVLAANADVEVAATSRVEQIMDNMTTRQKVTQMLMVDFRYWDEDLTDDVAQTGFTVMNDQIRQIVEDYDFGALIYFAQNLIDTEQSYNLSIALQEAATKDGGIPLIISADQEGGSVYRLGTGTALPGNMALGAVGTTEAAKAAGQIIGSELSVLGINTNLAPVV